MSFYEKFEQCVSLVLVFLISIMIVTALYKLEIKLYDPLVFQTLFGMIMTLLIAMEFKHWILRVIYRKDNIIQVKTVILITILIISRKFIILDTKKIPASELAALAETLLALGLVY